MFQQIWESRSLKTIAVVGNGPISEVDAPFIDEADFVLRFNGAPACGRAGQRVDVLMINRARVYMSKRINPIALHRAKEVWVNDTKELGQVDWLFERECTPRYLGFGPCEKARKHLQAYGAPPESNPTSGASIIAEILDTQPQAAIHLFGFTHEGKQQTHDWSAEAKWIADLVADGRIMRFLTPGKLPGRGLVGNLEYSVRFLEKHGKHYFFNKIAHSDKATKSRIFGRDG